MSSTPALPRLLVLASTYPRWHDDHEPGFVHELAKQLTKRFEVTVLAPSAPGTRRMERLDGVDVIRYRYAPRRLETLVYGGGMAANLRRARWKWMLVPCFLLGQWLAAFRLLRTRNVEVLHVHWLIPQGLVALCLSLFSRRPVPYVVTSHGGDLFGFRGRLASASKRTVINGAYAVTVVSTAMVAAVEQLGARPKQLAVLPMGVDLQSRFTPDASIARSSDELLFVGRLVEKKGLRHLIAALPVVVSRFPGATLTIVGFGPLEAELKREVANRSLADKVRFVGAVQQQDLPKFYRRAALLVAPFVTDRSGDQEGLPVVLMEAIGCGCPLVASDVPGVRDLIQGGEQNMLVPPADADALAAAICAKLSDPAGAQLHAREMREQGMRLIDWPVIADAYASLLGQAAACGARDGL